jgi:hypothetical protein
MSWKNLAFVGRQAAHRVAERKQDLIKAAIGHATTVVQAIGTLN